MVKAAVWKFGDRGFEPRSGIQVLKKQNVSSLLTRKDSIFFRTFVASNFRCFILLLFCTFVVSYFRTLAVSHFHCFELSLFRTFVVLFCTFVVSYFRCIVASYLRCFVLSLYRCFVVL